MEFLKSNTIIDQKYKPSLDNEYLEYFNRAMAFAQTNYQDQIQKVINTQFRKISPANFYEEYAWCVTYANEETIGAHKEFPLLSSQLSPFYHSFWDLNNFPKVDPIKNNIMNIIHDEKKFDALYKCADIVNRGIRLFGWDSYRNNYLSGSVKLRVLPLIGLRGANQLSRNIGASYDLISSDRLHYLAKHWKFETPLELCQAIQKYVPMQLKIIELILWYSVVTFTDS